MNLPAVSPTDHMACAAAISLWRKHIKPPRGLGLLEDVAAQFAAIEGTTAPTIRGRRMIVFCADHGVAAEGVSALGQGLTRHLIDVTLRGGSAISIFCRQFSIDLQMVDVGVRGGVDPSPGLLDRSLGEGTGNIRVSEAMSEVQLRKAFSVGRELAMVSYESQVNVLGLGEIGIGNTTSASALMSALLGLDPQETVGRGSGLSDEGILHKYKVVKDALYCNRSHLGGIDGCLRALGGFEIVAMVGALIEGAHRRMALVVDGFTSSIAALAAVKMCPAVKDYIFFSHLSGEHGHKALLGAIGGVPILDLGMRLGEGTGAAMCMPVIELSCRLLNELNCF